MQRGCNLELLSSCGVGVRFKVAEIVQHGYNLELLSSCGVGVWFRIAEIVQRGVGAGA